MYTNMKFYAEFDAYFDILVDAVKVFNELEIYIDFGFFVKNNYVEGYLRNPESDAFINVAWIFYSLKKFNDFELNFFKELYFKEVFDFIKKYEPQFFL